MPISDKILQLIDDLEATDKEKKLLTQILEVEEEGAYQFRERYAKLLKEYLAEKPEEGD